MIGALMLFGALLIATQFLAHSWLIAAGVTFGYALARLARSYYRYRRHWFRRSG